MARRFQQQAARQLNPLFNQQSQAVKQQIPAVNQMFDILLQGLEGQRETETQNILESASSRGVLRSTMPVDLQTSLGEALLAQRGKLESERAGQISGVQQRLADIGLARGQAVSSLAQQLQQGSLQEREFKLRQQEANRNFELEKRRLALARSQAAAQNQQSSGISSLLNRLNSGASGDDVITLSDIEEYLREIQGGGGRRPAPRGRVAGNRSAPRGSIRRSPPTPRQFNRPMFGRF